MDGSLKRPFDAEHPERAERDPLAELGVFGCARAIDLHVIRRVADVAHVCEHREALPEIEFTADINVEPLRPPRVGARLDARAGSDGRATLVSAVIPVRAKVVALASEIEA